MSHYDIDREYDDDKRFLSAKDFDKKWGYNLNPKNVKKETLKASRAEKNPTSAEYFTVKNISEMRVWVENGKARIVIDVDKNPTYEISVGKKETNSFLLQLLGKKDNG